MKPSTFALVTLLANAVSLFSPRPMWAQELVPGLRVRSQLSATGEWRTGTLLRFGRDSLVIQRCRDCAAEAQPWAGITRVEVSEGTTWSGRNIAIGALVAGTVAAWITKRNVDRDTARCEGGPCALAALEIPVAGVLGAFGGAVLGAFWRVESWREVYGEDTEPARK